MWTISSSRGSTRLGANTAKWATCAIALCAAFPAALRAQDVRVAPDAPRVRVTDPVRPLAGPQEWKQPVELTSVFARSLDSTLVRLAGEDFVRAAERPLAIEVHTVRPLDPTPRTSWPVVVLNGQVVRNSRVSPDSAQIIYGFLPDREQVRDRNTVEVFWVGNEESTRTRRSLILTRQEVDEVN